MSELTDNLYIEYNPTTKTIYARTADGGFPAEKTLAPEDPGYGDYIKVLEDGATIEKTQLVALKEQNAKLTQDGVKKDAELKEKDLRIQDREARIQEKEKKIQALTQKMKEQAKEIAKLLTGEAGRTLSDEIIQQYPEWQPGLSVDEGDAYRDEGILYIAKKDHVTSEENRPSKDLEAKFWYGGGHEKKPPAPVPGVKYPKGTETEYLGVRYYARVDTNDGPEVGYPTWDLVSNRED